MHIRFDDEQAFPRSEHERRIAVTREKMAEHGLELLAISSLRSAYYLFGYDLVGGGGMTHLVLLPLKDGPVTISWEGSVALLRDSIAGLIQTYSAPGDELPIMLETLRSIGPIRRIGLEGFGSSLPAKVEVGLRGMLEAMGAEIVDPCDIVGRQLVVKTLAEIGHIRRAAAILDAAFVASFDAMRPGAGM